MRTILGNLLAVSSIALVITVLLKLLILCSK